MIIDIDLYTSIIEGLNPNEYIFLYLLYKNHIITLQKLFKFTNYLTKDEVNSLINRKFLTAQPTFNIEKYTETLRHLIVEATFIKLLPQSITNPFEELLTKFPKRVKRTDGVNDYLLTDLKKSKIKYNNLVNKTTNLHQHILECLEYELKHRHKNNTMKFMRRLPNWLESEEWRTFEQSMEEDKDNIKNERIETSYGTELL